MGRRRYEPEFPKPFDFVEFADGVDKQNRPGHETFRDLSGELALTITVKTPLHISSGSYALTEDLGIQAKNIVRDAYKVTVNGRRLPAIPGSSLKGAVRAVVEAVTESCIGVTRVNWRDLPKGVSRSCRPPKLCPACGLFGAMNRQSRLSFGDMVFTAGDAAIFRMPALYRPRPQQGRAYRNAARQFKGRKFYYHGRLQKHKQGAYIEALKPGTELKGVIAFNNLALAELGLLLFALGLDGSFQLALGGGKPVAMGRVQATATELRLRQTAAFLEYDGGDEVKKGDALAKMIREAIAAAGSLILADQKTQLREILDPANPRPAPTGVY